MVKAKEDLTGRIFGRLKVLEQAEDYISPKGIHRSQWLCQCSCGSEPCVIVGGSLTKKNNPTRSCGCLIVDRIKETNKKYNKYDLTGEYGIGWTSNTNEEFYFDLDDYDKIKNYCWSEHILTNGYSRLEAWSDTEKRIVRMTELLLCDGYDHKDRNSLNNRRGNLRIATSQENAQNHSKRKDNISGVTGVSWDNCENKWLSYIGVNRKTIKLGRYINKEDAIKARLKAELKYFGKEFAPQRHLFEQYNITLQNDCGVI